MDHFYYRYIKRPLDIVVSFSMLVLLSPVFLIVSMLVWLNLGRPVIFRQKRPGFNEQPFEILKFRTMNGTYSERGSSAPDVVRLTRLGQFLRATSLDELPQLLNILKGEMSFVGPRPLLFKYLPYYTQEERLRHAVRPGLTGLAQVHGRNYASWDKRLKYDIRYVHEVSFILDLKILLRTVHRVLFGRDVARDPQFMRSLDRERGLQ